MVITNCIKYQISGGSVISIMGRTIMAVAIQLNAINTHEKLCIVIGSKSSLILISAENLFNILLIESA